MTNKPPGSIRPVRLQPGMTIGIVAPSSPIRDPARETAGLKCLEVAGYRYVLADHIFDGHGYLAGMDKDRAADFTAMFKRKDVDAIMCARGGYGAVRMVDLIDWEVVAAKPKPFIGFSDITTLHMAFENRTGMVTHYGPILTSLGKGLEEDASGCFWNSLQNAEPLGVLPTGGAEISTLVRGRADGRLAGGCITLLCMAPGTIDAPDFPGRIVVLEHIEDAVYLFDRS